MSTRSLNSSRQLPHIRMSGLPAKKLDVNISHISNVNLSIYQDVKSALKKSNVNVFKILIDLAMKQI